MAVDSRNGQVHVYISDTFNSRVLAWRDAQAYQIGDPPVLVLGQPGPQISKPYGIGSKGFNGPFGMAVDPTTGNLYVADTGNNRVAPLPGALLEPVPRGTRCGLWTAWVQHLHCRDDQKPR